MKFNRSKASILSLLSENVFSSQYRYFAQAYSELAQESHPLSALSILSQNKDEIIANKSRMVNAIQDRIKNYFKEEHIDNGFDAVIECYQLANRKSNLNTEKLEALSTSFLSGSLSTLDRFGRLLSKYLKPKFDDEFYYKPIYHEVKAVKEEEERLEAIQAVISEVIKNDYPKQIEKEPSSDQLDRVRNAGRNKFLDQERITKRVAEIVERAIQKEDGYKQFWHHSGRYQGRANKNQIKEKLFKEGLVTYKEEGVEKALDDRTVLNYVDTALIQLGYMKK